MEPMTSECSRKIYDTVIQDEFKNFIEKIAYLIRYSNSHADLIHKYSNDYISEIMNKPVNELTNEEKVHVMIHWMFKNGGVGKYEETPIFIIEHLTDNEVVHEFNRRCNDPSSSVTIKSSAVIENKED